MRQKFYYLVAMSRENDYNLTIVLESTLRSVQPRRVHIIYLHFINQQQFLVNGSATVNK